jgi:hypothetical protein
MSHIFFDKGISIRRFMRKVEELGLVFFIFSLHMENLLSPSNPIVIKFLYIFQVFCVLKICISLLEITFFCYYNRR